VSLSDEFRQRAAECVRWAEDATSRSDQERWQAMAEFWTRLAAYADEQEAVLGIDMTQMPRDQTKGEDNGNGPARPS